MNSVDKTSGNNGDMIEFPQGIGIVYPLFGGTDAVPARHGLVGYQTSA